MVSDEGQSEVSQYKVSLKGQSCSEENVSVHQAEKLSLEGIRRFVAASEALRFEGKSRERVYVWVEQVLCQ